MIDSVKAAPEIYSPTAGKITKINDALLDALTLTTPEGAMENWLFKLNITYITALNHLMDKDA